MASAKTIKSNAIPSQKSRTTRRRALNTLRSANSVIVPKLRNSASDTVALDDIEEVQEATLIAKGGCNSVWLVKLHGIFEVGPSVTDLIAIPVSIATDNGATCSLRRLSRRTVIPQPAASSPLASTFSGFPVKTLYSHTRSQTRWRAETSSLSSFRMSRYRGSSFIRRPLATTSPLLPRSISRAFLSAHNG